MKRFILVEVPNDATDIFINNVGCIRYSHNQGRESTAIEPVQIGHYLEKDKHQIVGEAIMDNKRMLVIEIGNTNNVLEDNTNIILVDINVKGIGIIEAMKVRSYDDIKKCKRLFIRDNDNVGVFRELQNVSEFIKHEDSEQENRIKSTCADASYIEYHNFHVII